MVGVLRKNYGLHDIINGCGDKNTFIALVFGRVAIYWWLRFAANPFPSSACVVIYTPLQV